MPVEEGKKAPAFNLETTSGDKIALKDLAGKTVVLYFYPKDNTSGCTKEAENFRDDYSNFQTRDVVLLGISPDSRQSHQKFTEKLNLPFPLLVDKDHKIAEKYGVWVEKKMFGKTGYGIQRATFIIGPDGKIIKVYPKVRVDGHSQEVLNDLNELDL
ncbi:MAG: thioredoxin-dependent thiol peroxidase [candidate division Zixibacteria bacterium]|nr:thioredoxin-dependent thiol peroxidase [candidate division Zixibacteria bacterium]